MVLWLGNTSGCQNWMIELNGGQLLLSSQAENASVYSKGVSFIKTSFF